MTLPININLPLTSNQITSKDPQELLSYIRALTYALSTYIQQANQSANGTFTTYSDTLTPTYTFIVGSTTAGTATYANTILQVRRSNLLTMVWFDITWSAHTGTGNTLIQLPYFSQPSDQYPYSCVIESDNMTFSAGYTYLTGNLTPSTNTIVVNQNGSAQAILPLSLPNAGHLRGMITYVGRQFT